MVNLIKSTYRPAFCISSAKGAKVFKGIGSRNCAILYTIVLNYRRQCYIIGMKKSSWYRISLSYSKSWSVTQWALTNIFSWGKNLSFFLKTHFLHCKLCFNRNFPWLALSFLSLILIMLPGSGMTLQICEI